MRTGRLRWALDCAAWRPSPDEWRAALGALPDDDAARVMRFVRESDRKLALGSRLLQRRACAEVLGARWRDVDVARTALGKPYLRAVGGAVGGARARRPDLPCFNFNASHHGAFVALASEPGCAVGLDVMNEAERPPRALGASADEYFASFAAQFAPAEWDAIHAPGGGGGGGDDERERARFARFYRFWALKESYIKAHGEGLGHALDRLVFRVGDADAPRAAGGAARPPALPLDCLLYTSPSPRDRTRSRMPSSA